MFNSTFLQTKINNMNNSTKTTITSCVSRSQTKTSLLKKFILRTAGVFSLLLFFGNQANGQTYLATESFDGATFVPTGWTNFLTSGTNTWTRVTSGTFPTCATQSGAGMAKFNSYSANSGVRSLISPVMNFSTAGTKRISFWMYRDNGYNTYADRIEVLTNTAANTTGATLIGTVNRAIGLAPTVAANGWYNYTFDVTTTSATTYLILRATSTYGNNIYVDNIGVAAPPLPCSGTPSPGNTLSSGASPVCSGTSFTLSLQNTTSGTGVTYQWQHSTDGGITWASVDLATSSTLVTSQTVAKSYKCNVTCSGATGTSTAISLGLSSFINCYCAASATSTADEEISNVTFGTLNNSSTCTTLAPGANSVVSMYSNYTSGAGAPAAPNVAQGDPVNYAVTMTSCGGVWGNTTAMYIDYNQNGSFAEANEKVYQSAYLNGNHTDVGSTTIPLTALTGNTRMRVVNFEATTAPFCGTSSWGEVEDYIINITPFVPCSTPAPGNTLATNSAPCLGNNATLSLQNPTGGGGVTYQWYNSAGLIAGATASSYTITNASASSTYYCAVACSNNSSVTNSNPITINPYSVTTFPWKENFDATSPSIGCWTVSQGAGASYAWALTTADATYGAAAPAASNRFAYLYVFLASNLYNTYNLLSPNISLGADPKKLKYNYFLGANGYTATPVPLALQISTNNGTSWTTIYSHTSANSTFANSSTSPWQLNTIDLTAYANMNVKFKFVSNSNYGSYTCDQGIDEFTISSIAPTLASASPLSVCPNNGTITITGTGLSEVSGVKIGGTPVTSYVINSDTQITAAAGAGTDGVVTLDYSSLNGTASTITGSQSITFLAAPAVPTPSVTSLSTTFGGSISVGVNNPDPLLTYSWFSQATGGSAIAMPLTACASINSTNIYLSASDGQCASLRAAVAITVALPEIVSTDVSGAEQNEFCGVGGNLALTAAPLNTSTTSIAWQSLTPGATISSLSANPTSVDFLNTSDFMLTASVAGCPDYTTVKSIGVYPLPTAVVTTTASGVCAGTSATINSGLSAGNFTVTSIPHVVKTPPTTAGVLMNNGVMVTPLSGGNSDDGGWGGIPIGFTFNYFGNNFTTIGAGTNGVLMFGTIPGYGTADGQLGDFTFTGPPYFPNPANAGNLIALLAADLHMGNSTNGSLKYWTEGYAPNRKFVLKYTNVHSFSSNPAATVSIVLYETTGIVDIFITSKTFAASSIVGLQDQTKTIGAVAPGRAGGTWTVTTPEGWRFAPPADYLTIWTANGAQIASGVNIFEQSVSPQITTLYDISYTNQTTLCSNEPNSAQATMVILGNTVVGDFAATATVASTCPGTAVPLTHTYVGPNNSNSGLSYQWQSSVAGGDFLDIAGATLPTYSALQSVATSYRVGIQSCLGTPAYSSPVAISLLDFMTCYCTPNTGTIYDEEITNVTLSTLNNSSTCTDLAPGAGSVTAVYGNYTGLPQTNIYQNVPVSGSLTIGSCGTYNYSSGAAIFIDYNHNGLFTDAGEKVWSNGSAANIACVPASTVSASFTPPLTSLPGLTRMRIISNESAAGNNILPCTSPLWGEVEDYIVNIVAPPTAPATPTATNAGSCILGETISMVGTAPEGVAYYWQTTANGTSLDNSASTWIVYGNGTYYIRAYASLGGQWSTATAITLGAFPIVLPPTAITNLSGTPYCAAVTLQAGAAPLATTYYWQGTNPIGISNALPASTNATATASGTYYIAARNDTTLCWSATTSISVVVYPAPTGTAVATLPVSCPSPNASVLFNVSGAGGLALGAAGVISSDFSTATLPAGATLAGNNALIVGGQLRLTSAANNMNGGILIPNPTNVSSNNYQIDFDLITTSSGSSTPADGFSYSYGPNVVAVPTGTGSSTVGATVQPGSTNPENGSGSNLKIAFDAYTNGANTQGIYAMYNAPIWNQTPTSTGVLNYSNNVAWRATATAGATTHVTVKINDAGQLSMLLNGAPYITNQQLPASYLTDNKALWKHALSARTGGLNQGHFIDNLNIQYGNSNMFEYSIDNTTWTTANPISAAPGTYNASVRYAGVGGCVVSLGSVTIAPIAAPTITVSTPVSTVCFGAPVTFTANIANQGTLPSACNYTFNMVDSWGDGWNGAQMRVMNGTTIVATLTLASGSSAAQTVSLQSGISYSLVWNTAGIFPEEVGVSVVDPSGTTIYTMLPSGLDLPLSGTLTTIAPSSLVAYSTIAWKVNNVAVAGANGLTYTPSSLNAGDYVTASVIINYPCPSNTVVSTPIFVVANTSVTTTVTAASSYTWANNGQTYTASGVYTGTTTNCVTQMLNLTILPTLTLNVLLDGYYVIGSSPAEMRPARYNNLVAAIPSGSGYAVALAALSGNTQDVDLITVQLRGTTSGLPILHTATPMLKKDGSVICEFPASAIGGSYWVVVDHRASMPLWSQNPITLSNSSTLNFANIIASAYSDGDALLTPMKTISSGLYGIWMGELDQTGYLDAFDYSNLEGDIYESGYLGQYLLDGDLNGDSYVDATDFAVFDFNSIRGLYEQRPY